MELSPEHSLYALRRAYQRHYQLCCAVRTEAAYTHLTILRYRAVRLASHYGLDIGDRDFRDPTKASILACIARCEKLHTALVAELRG